MHIIEPAFQINDLPFLYADEKKAHAVLDGEAGQKLMQKLESKNIIGLGFAEGGFRQMINNVRAVETPDDVAGIKWRVMQNPVYIGMFRSLVGSLLTSVFFRYVVGQALSWPEEISLIIFTWLVLLTGSLGVREEFHVRLTLFSSRLPGLYRRILEKIIQALIAAFGLVLVYSGYDLVQRTAQHLTPTLRLPLDWVNYAASVCGLLIFLHAAAAMVRTGAGEVDQ